MNDTDEQIAVTADDVWPADAETDEGVVVNWFVRQGGTVEAGETLCEVQVEKVSFDVYAPADGTLEEIVLDEDDEFERTAVIAYIEPSAE